MKRYAVLGVLVIVAGILIFQVAKIKGEEMEKREPLKEKSIYEFTMKSIDGKDVSIDHYKGKVLMIVNVASRCGYTYQYEGLEKVYNKYKDQGFEILGFPANNFGSQEPGSNQEIATFCKSKYSVSFPMFSKISVNGSDINSFYRFLTEPATDPQFSGEITWNFNKFLIDKNGNIVGRFDSGNEPDSQAVTGAIEKALK
jgi:glutathione peroxidase